MAISVTQTQPECNMERHYIAENPSFLPLCLLCGKVHTHLPPRTRGYTKGRSDAPLKYHEVVLAQLQNPLERTTSYIGILLD